MSEDWSVILDMRAQNFDKIFSKVHGLPKNLHFAVKDVMRDYFHKDFNPMLGRILSGFKATSVPAQNSPNWAAIKSAQYGIGHSLGRISGFLHSEATAVQPKISMTGNKTTLVADYSDIPKADYPYFLIVHEGLDRLGKSYPMGEAARLMTHKRLLRRLGSLLSKAWEKKGG